MGVPGGGGLHGFHVIRAEGLKLVRWGGGGVYLDRGQLHGLDHFVVDTLEISNALDTELYAHPICNLG